MLNIRKNRILIVTFFLALYCFGYLIARYTHLIVHRSGYSTNLQGITLTASHGIAAGDFGVPMLSLGFSYFQPVLSYIYLPIRYIERIYWLITNPIGSEWPYRGLLHI